MLLNQQENLLQKLIDFRLRLMIFCQYGSYLSNDCAVGYFLKIINLRQAQQFTAFKTVNFLSGGNLQLQTGKGLQ